ncbi:hypothetical protein [Hyphomicrobium sp. D-2]|nr:hypothetical protein [Hyphomicrobium sp. D-2]MDH4981350.1 hypothetical protein [Hyphomicrobium sp. D-2]
MESPGEAIEGLAARADDGYVSRTSTCWYREAATAILEAPKGD